MTWPTTVTRADWERQYRAGRWSYLAEAGEVRRYRYLADWVLGRGVMTVLDVGCGEGLLREALGGDHFPGRYLGVDWSLSGLPKEAMPTGHAFVCADIERLPVIGRFELIVASEVLYYLSSPMAVLDRLKELLTPQGTILVSVYQPKAGRGDGWREVVEGLDRLLIPGQADAGGLVTEPSNGRTWRMYAIKGGG